MLRRIAVIFGYFLLTAIVILTTIGLVAYGQDYSYSFSQHRVVRSGNVIIQSVPSGVSISVNGKKSTHKTSYRLEAGTSYTFTIAKTGYQPWKKVLPVAAGRVTLVQYVVLAPTNPPTSKLLSLSTLASESWSRDHRHLAYVTVGSPQSVYTYDPGSKATKIYTAAAATDTSAIEVIDNVVWSDDASHLLITSQYNGVTTTRVIASNGSGQISLTSQYGFDFSSLHFSGNNWRQLYWISPDGLRRLDLDSQTVSGVLAANVKQFYVNGDHVFYVVSTNSLESLWLLDGTNHKPQELIAALPTSDSFALSYVRFSGSDVMAVVPSSTQVGTLYSDIFGDTPVAQTVAHGVTDVSFSADGHLAAFSGGTNVTTYDLDQSNLFGTPVLYTYSAPGLVGAPVWFDNFHLLGNENGRLVLRDYDGQNAINLGDTNSSFAPVPSNDLKSLYLWGPTTTDTVLTQITIKP